MKGLREKGAWLPPCWWMLGSSRSRKAGNRCQCSLFMAEHCCLWLFLSVLTRRWVSEGGVLNHSYQMFNISSIQCHSRVANAVIAGCFWLKVLWIGWGRTSLVVKALLCLPEITWWERNSECLKMQLFWCGTAVVEAARFQLSGPEGSTCMKSGVNSGVLLESEVIILLISAPLQWNF